MLKLLIALDSDDDVDTDMSTKLAQWVTTRNISKNATRFLLSILSPHFPSLSRDPHTLLNTPMQLPIRNLKGGGQYCHMGLASGLCTAVNAESCDLQHLELQINIDGLPLFKSSGTCLWPIMALIKNMPSKDPFIVGLYYGQEKPGDAAEILSEFVSEACRLIADGIIINHTHYTVDIHSFVCDAPARFHKGD